jgi:hypothetical protein
VAGVVGPVVVVDVPEAGGADLGGTARGGVNVVVREGDLVVFAEGEDSPVVVAIAGGRPVGGAVELVVREGDASACSR